MKILCIRFSALGDLLVCTPVFRALAVQKNAEVHLLTKPVAAQVVKHNRYLHKIHVWESADLLKNLKAEKFDLVVDLHCNLRSHLLRLKLGVPVLGYKKRNFSKRLLEYGIDRFGEQHLIDRYFKALQPISVDYDGQGLDYFFDQNAKAPLIGFDQQNYLAIVLGATHYTKRMPTELVVRICQQYHGPVILLGGRDVEATGSEIEQRIADGNKLQNLCGKTTIEESARILQTAKAVLTSDTGMMHITAALAKPMVVVWGNTVPAFGMYPLMAKGNSGKVFNAQVDGLDCRPCSRIGYAACPKKHFSCMRDQSVDLILKKLEELSSTSDK